MVKKLKYIWVDEREKFLKLSGLGPGMKHSDFHEIYQPDSIQQERLRKLYGRNEVLIHVQSYLTLLGLEILSPYYFFQFFSIVVWIADDYLYYTYAILVVSILSIIITVVQTHKAQLNLRKTVESSDMTKAELLYADDRREVTSYSNLVPGDRIIIPDNEEYTVPCDAVILTGACIVQESMLTGESVPLTKTALPASNEKYIEKESRNHLLFNGTKVIQTRREEGKSVVALVIRTGFTTAKGDLVRAILYPPPVDYAFEQSVYTFINLSAIGAFSLACVVCVWLAAKKMAPLQVFTKSFELVTMVIPAVIPGSLTLSKVYAIQRFRKQKIACINSKVINVAGSSNCVCFDKTGTITEDGLDVWGVVPSDNGRFKEPINNASSLENDRLKFALASCHSLSLNQNRLFGDPLDIKMFESTSWIFDDDVRSEFYSGSIVYPHLPGKDSLHIRLLYQIQFESSLQRMSMVTQKCDSDSTYYLYCKGSPEMIASLSLPQSVPADLDEILKTYTKRGYRVLALGCRHLEGYKLEVIKKTPRAELETDLEFLGLFILENKVKPASKPTIDLLKNGNFKITMITGDNMQTAICVSRECKIIETNEELLEISAQGDKLICTASRSFNEIIFQEVNLKKSEEGQNSRPYTLALSGKAWEIVKRQYEEYLPQILVRTAVFARMTSRQKQQVVTELQAIGYCVVMCGDGANDCAALKAANVGVSLSQAEASVASPLSSAKEDISCIPTVVREGRASLIASFGLIKFILCYGYIQLTSALISYGFNSNLSDLEFIWEDIFLVIVFTLFFGLTNAYEGKIVSQTPTMKLLSCIPILSLMIHMLVFIIFQFIIYFWIQTYPWYVDGPVDKNLPQTNEFMITYSYKNYAVFSISIFQVIISGVVFSKGYPYRKPLYTNYLYSIAIIFMTVLTALLTTYPGTWVQELFVMALPPIEFRFIIVATAFVNFVVSYIIESFLIEYLISQKVMNLPFFKNKMEKYKYEIALDGTSGTGWISNFVQTYTHVDKLTQ